MTHLSKLDAHTSSTRAIDHTHSGKEKGGGRELEAIGHTPTLDRHHQHEDAAERHDYLPGKWKRLLVRLHEKEEKQQLHRASEHRREKRGPETTQWFTSQGNNPP